MKNNQNEFSVIVPAFNEQKNLPKVIEELKKIVEKDKIIIVDDGSTDETYNTAKNLGVTVLKLDKNCGKGTAVRNGIANAKTEIIVLIDADGQHEAKEIPKLVQKLVDTQASLALGSRYLKKSNKIPLLRDAANRTMSLIVSISGVRCTDSLCGLRAFRKKDFSQLKSAGYEIELEMLARVKEKKLKITEAPCTVYYHSNREGKLSSLAGGIKGFAKLIYYWTKKLLYSNL